MTMEQKIDLVLPWVDGQDAEWQKEKGKYQAEQKEDDNVNRYRDWGFLPYWFRGVEKNLPWIRKIHFITWGHLPKWLNKEHEKLNIVNHQDYIPEKYLPTFSSHVIELNLFRIDELSDNFIYANDDTIFLAPMKEEDFFRNGLPCDFPIQNVLQFRPGGIDHIIANNLEVMNTLFVKRECLRENWRKWFSMKLGSGVLKNIYLLPFTGFTGFENGHMPLALLKSSQKELWERAFEKADGTCRHKFRNNEDINQWMTRYYQFGKGQFVPEGNRSGKFLVIGKDDKEIKNIIKKRAYSMICLSDDEINVDFIKEKRKILGYLEKVFPEKSSFEL